MRRFLIGLLATLGALVLVFGLAVGGLIWWFVRSGPEPLPDSMLLTLDLRRPVLEGTAGFGAGWLAPREDYRLLDLVRALDRAAGDPRVKAVYARLDEAPRGLAVTQELRQAVLRVAAAGKSTIAFADSLGELSPGNEGYYLASAFQQITIQPMGSVGLTGLALEEPFAEGLLAKLGIELEVTRRSEYKTALDFVAASEPSPAHREMSEALIGSLDEQFRADIERSRPAVAGRIDGLIDGGPYTGQAALAAGLIDRLAFEDVLLEELRRGAGAPDGGRLQRVDLDDYAERGERAAPESAPVIAVVHALGPILRGTTGFDDSTAAADDVAAALSAAREDQSVRAVLFRISSPGGSPVASETISREIERLKDAGKPVVVSMGDVAGSGGYWIAADADVIMANPATLTGSIGVIAGKPVLDALWAWLDVNWTLTSRSEAAGIWSLNKPYTPAELAKVNASVDAIYAAFKDRVAAGRGLTAVQVEDVARGRVWTGAQAKPAGLVDELGGLFEAIGATKKQMGLREEDEVALVLYPDPSESFGRMIGRLTRGLTGAMALGDRLAGLVTVGPGAVGMSPPSFH
ncbi:MAG TPA: S49 family peptidase [Geminicoccus sp.]|jgi:protease-4|uniref:S49 family peptidase n=1 Tax=Geminicoccus sp. TaxID=2024832 RepID=UPI002E36A236|nr:S49 family peptidase [Geminicoccus sp.]HEX2529122.1 S49 family peptidase [Geminicoccus sp.]